MIEFRKALAMIASIPNTLRFNLHYFKIKDAIHFPVLVSYKVRLEELGDRGSVFCPRKFATIKLGFSDGSYSMGKNKRSTFSHEKGSVLKFEGSATFCNPFYITLKNKSSIVVGDNFKANTNLILNSARQIVFGRDCLVAWNVTIIDGDGHFIMGDKDDSILNCPREIFIGDHTWIASGSTILKGVTLASDTIVSANALVTGVFAETKTIVGGVPCRIIKRNVSWKEEWIK